MRKIKPNFKEQIALHFGLAAIFLLAIGLPAPIHEPARTPITAPAAAGQTSVTTVRHNQHYRHLSAKTAQPAAAPAAPVNLASAHLSAAPAATTPIHSIDYPGLPRYPHTQYEYHSLTTPTGPLYSMEPFLDRISAPAGWDSATAAASNPAPTIAVIDTGFALNHEDLTGRWAINPNEIAGSTVDNDGDGYAGNWRGWDFVHNDADPMAGTDNPTGNAVSHGTETAGLAGLINANAKIMPLQALDDNGSGYTDDVSAAVRYAADHGANIISLSLGTTTDDPYLHEQIDYAISKGAVVVAAAGNDGCDCMLYPANYPEVLSVGSATSYTTRASFSSYGPNLDVMAPGTSGDVCSSAYDPNGTTNTYTCNIAGTSFATPIVSGLAALLVQQCPLCSNVDINTAVELGSDQFTSSSGILRVDTSGYGLIDVARSVTLVSETADTPLGQLASKHNLSLSGTSLQTGPSMDTTCAGLPGSSCELIFQGPQGQTVSGGTATLDFQYGGAVFDWNAQTLGLTAGQWKVMTTVTTNGTTASTLADLINISP